MRITALVENTSLRQDCAAEHGLSLYIETSRHRILFDSGASANFIKNAEKLGIDLRDVDIAVLSHGHYDHAGGMTAFFRLNSRARLYARDGYGLSRYSRDGRYIGVEPLLIGNPRVVTIREERLRLDGEVTIAAYTDQPCAWPVNTFGMMVDAGDMLRPEQFMHEQYLLVNEGGRKVIFTGCSHRGICNIMSWSSREGVQAVVGGFHTKDVPEEKFGSVLAPAAEELRKYPVTYYTCHCTGQPQYEYLKKLMGDQLQYLPGSKTLEI
jgi:7,8-dihydropterin-6-yl-methyl-4-(beta-D-ribofuranosyl)aminobenzene 5'-phosphate synthase